MPRANLIAYVPTLNQRHLAWFKRHPDSDLFLISQKEAERFLPRLARNMAALPTEMVARMVSLSEWVRCVRIFAPGMENYNHAFPFPVSDEWVLPDEDVSHLFAEKYLVPAGCTFSFEMIWARWDMTAVTRNQPVIPDVEISFSKFDRELMEKAVEISNRSPDWWRTIGALAVLWNGQVIPAVCNFHMPNEYETYIFGDPGLNRDAGFVGKYTSMHAEEAVITHCSRHLGLALDGAHLYVTTFPCERCARQVAQVGVRKLFFKEGFSSLNAQDVLRAKGVKIIQVKTPEA
ncbi:MAG: deaminase [Patescibacteria group bacterium]